MKKQLNLLEFQDLISSFPSGFSHYEIKQNQIDYRLKNNEEYEYKLIIPKIYHSDQMAYPLRLKELFSAKEAYLIILVEAGKAIVSLICADEILKYKLIKKYMVRKTQGKAQYNHLSRKGKSRLGSRIRLRQTDEFFEELNDIIANYMTIHKPHRIYLHCSPSLKGEWFSRCKTPFDKKDPRLERLGLNVADINQKQLKLIIKSLTTAYYC